MASAKPATTPLASQVGESCTAKTVPLVPSDTTTSPGPMPNPRAAPMLSPVPAATSIPCPVRPAGSVGPRTLGTPSERPNARSRMSMRYSPLAGDQYPVPDASPRSVAVSCFPPRPPRSCHVSQSCGNRTCSAALASSGSCSAVQRSLVTVKLATGTLPTACAHASAPPSSSTSSVAASPLRVSFHSRAGRTTLPASSRSTMPCCWPATAMDSTPSRSPCEACSNACHQTCGSISVPSGCAADADRWTSPVSASQTTTFVDWVEQSTPATIGMAQIMPALARRVAVV